MQTTKQQATTLKTNKQQMIKETDIALKRQFESNYDEDEIVEEKKSKSL